MIDRARFVCADVYDAFDALGGQTFDIVYVSLGALCWLPSADRFAEQVGALVAPGGRFYLHEQHPVEWALADDEATFAHAYFEESSPYVDESESTYTDGVRPLINRRSYQWNHGIGETVTALIRHASAWNGSSNTTGSWSLASLGSLAPPMITGPRQRGWRGFH